MKLIKDNLHTIVKLFVNQIGVAIFAFMLYTAIGAMRLEASATRTVNLLISIFSLLFYLFLLYTVVWEIGAIDRIAVDTGREKKQPLKGMILSAVSNLPNFLLGGVCILLIALHLSTGAEGPKTAFGILNLIYRMLDSIYLGIVSFVFPTVTEDVAVYLYQSILFVALLLIPILVCQAAYAMGFAEIRVFKFKRKK